MGREGGRKKKKRTAAAAAAAAAAAEAEEGARSDFLSKQPFVESLNESTRMFNELFARIAPTRTIPYKVPGSKCIDPASLTLTQVEAVIHLSGYLNTANKCIESNKVAKLPEYKFLGEDATEIGLDIDSPESKQIRKEVEAHLTRSIHATAELARKIQLKNANFARETAELKQISASYLFVCWFLWVIR